MSKPDIHLHVERLVLDAATANRDRVGDAVASELSRLLTQHGIGSGLAGGAEIDRLDAGAFRPAPAAEPSAVGAQIARAVHKGLVR